MKYTKLISSSEARYYINKGENEILKTAKNSQGSYNLPSEFLEAAREKNVLVQDPSIDYARKSTDRDAFVVSEEYKFKLGKGALWLIGEDYANVNNKFIASINASNGKFQLYRTVYKKLDSKEYEWFIALIDNNLAGNELILDIDEENQTLTLDVKFNVINKGIDRSEIESEEDDENNEQEINNDFELNIEHTHNRIVFGAPGTGKSNRLENDKVVFGQNFERVTFHPNYSYAQFVGTYKPVPVKELVKGVETTTITYKYVPGPFMRTYVKAIRSIKENNPKPYLLLIEEINRANVAAVFGDVFQLLDRDNGQSEYEIETSEDMRAYLAKELKGKESDYERIRIPRNMYLWATMNSADQGVFPIDTAFKRRWNFEYIGINENSDGIKDIIVKLGKDEHDVNWNDLRIAINNKLSKVCKVNEDKLLGPYFLSKDVISTPEANNYVKDNKKFIEAFKSKIIMYLYEDAAKQYKQKLFEGCSDYSKYSSVCEAFDKIGEVIFGIDTQYDIFDRENVDIYSTQGRKVDNLSYIAEKE
ncbi:MAG: AAA family ATPase [Romboutsia sp.]